jgi:hypothetical protein
MPLSRTSAVRIRTKAIVVENSRAAALDDRLEHRQFRRGECLAPCAGVAAGNSESSAALEHVLDLGRILARVEVRHVVDLVVRNRNAEAVAEVAHRIGVELLLLVRRIERFTGCAHAVTLDRLGQDHGRHVLRVHRDVVRSVDLVRIVAAAIEPPDIVVGQVAHHLERLRILTEEMLARVRAAERLACLVFAVDGLHHQLAQRTVAVLRQ